MHFPHPHTPTPCQPQHLRGSDVASCIGVPCWVVRWCSHWCAPRSIFCVWKGVCHPIIIIVGNCHRPSLAPQAAVDASDAQEGYMTSLNRSLALALDEFYSTITTVGRSPLLSATASVGCPVGSCVPFVCIFLPHLWCMHWSGGGICCNRRGNVRLV